MATISETLVEYPSSDGKPMAETPIHRENMTDVIAMLEDWYLPDPQVYVSGNMMMYYARGDKRRHVSPDVFVARGIAKRKRRPYYLVWEEIAPQCVIELTSASTRNEDLRDKFNLYEQTLKVQEYFLFDPEGDYLEPSLQGYRLVKGKYARIKPVHGRLPSKVTGLHLERAGDRLRLWDPTQKRRLLTSREALVERDALGQSIVERLAALETESLASQAEVKSMRKAVEEFATHRELMEQELSGAKAGLAQSMTENERLRQLIRDLERKLPPTS